MVCSLCIAISFARVPPPVCTPLGCVFRYITYSLQLSIRPPCSHKRLSHSVLRCLLGEELRREITKGISKVCVRPLSSCDPAFHRADCFAILVDSQRSPHADVHVD